MAHRSTDAPPPDASWPAAKDAPSRPREASLEALRRGFTLIELLIVLAMIAIIFGAVYGTYAAAAKSVERLRDRAELYQQGRALLSLMAREVRCAYVPLPREEAGTEGAETADEERIVGLAQDKGGLLRVLTASAMTGLGGQAGGLAVVRYRLVGGTLQRAQESALAPKGAAGQWLPVARDVRKVEFEYYDGKGWTPGLPPEKDGATVPRGVRITVVMAREGGRQLRFRTAVYAGRRAEKPEVEIEIREEGGR